MFSTLGGISTALVVLLCSQITLVLSICWLVVRVRRLSRQVSLATQPEKAPGAWESRLADVQADLVSLSSSFEKVARGVTKLNSRAGMRELRGRDDEPAPPPIGASKGELRRYYGFRQDGPEFAKHQLSLVSKE